MNQIFPPSDPACFLNIAPPPGGAITISVTVQTMTLEFPLPLSTALIDPRLWEQTMHLQVTKTGALAAVTSNGVELTLGAF